MRNYYVVCLMLTVLISSSICFNPVDASNENSLSITTGEIEIGAGVRVECDYTVPVRIHHPETMVPKEEVEWAVSVATGEIDLRVYIPSPVSSWYSVAKKLVPVDLGTDIDIPISIPGAMIKARVKTRITASLNLDGPAALDKNTLMWSSDGSQVFNVTANSGGEGKQIQVIMSGNLGISLSLVVNIAGLFEWEIGLTDLGVFDFQPISETMDIVPDWRVLQEQINTLQGQITTLQNDLDNVQREYDALLNSPPWSTVYILTVALIITIVASAMIVYKIRAGRVETLN